MRGNSLSAVVFSSIFPSMKMESMYFFFKGTQVWKECLPLFFFLCILIRASIFKVFPIQTPILILSLSNTVNLQKIICNPCSILLGGCRVGRVCAVGSEKAN